MGNETLGKENFSSLINKVYQQLSSINSIEKQYERLALLKSLKNFEANYVYNWQRFIYPIFSGPETSPYRKYSGFRSAPWAEYDVLDPVHGGASGWTVTAEPWATEEGLPCLWDFTRGQPNSITGALYCLSSRIDQLQLQDMDFEEYDDTEIRGLINCNKLNIETLYKDIYACDLEPDCSGERKLRYSFQRHLYEIFSQIISGGPDMSGDFSCEEDYPELFLNITTCDIAWDPSCPLVELDGESITDGAKIQLTNNNSPYDHIEVIGSGATTVSWDETNQRITISSTDENDNTSYTYTSRQDGSDVDLVLTSSESTEDVVKLTAGSNITLTDNGSNEVEIASSNTTYELDSTQDGSNVRVDLNGSDSSTTNVLLVAGNNITLTESSNSITVDSTAVNRSYTTSVSSSNATSANIDLIENSNTTVSSTNISGAGTVSVSRISDSEIQVSGSQSVFGLNDSISILGQGALTPIPAIDYYNEKNVGENVECCYEYNSDGQGGTRYTKAYDEWGIGVPAGGPVTTGTTRHFKGTPTSEYSFNSTDGMSISFWVKKDDGDTVNGLSGRCTAVAFENHTPADEVNPESTTTVFSLFFNHASKESSDPDNSNDYCLYLETSKGALLRLANFSDIDGQGTSVLNNWQHIAISWEDLDNRFLNFTFYRGGKEESHSILLTGSGSGFDTYNRYSVYALSAPLTRDFDGHMKKLAIFKEKLTANEVAGVFLEEAYNANYTQTQWLTSDYINGKLADWWDLGNLDPIVSSTDSPFTEGDQLSQGFLINSRLNNVQINGVAYTGTSIQPPAGVNTNFTYTAFNFTAAVTLGGNNQTATEATALFQFDYTSALPTLTSQETAEVEITTGMLTGVGVKQVTAKLIILDSNEYTNQNISANNISESNGIYTVYTYIDSVNDNWVDLKDRIALSIDRFGFISADFDATYIYDMTVKSIYKGYLANGTVTLNAKMEEFFVANDSLLAGGAPSTVACGDLSKATKAETVINFSNVVDVGTTIEIISTRGTQLTYIAVDDSGVNGNKNANGQIEFRRGNSSGDPNIGLKSLFLAIDGGNGHNAGISNNVIELYFNGRSLLLKQAVGGEDGNTPVTVGGDPNFYVGVANQGAFDFGTNGPEFQPSNKEWFSQTSLFNKWDCSTQELDLTIGNRYDITITGYNTFKLSTSPWCIPLDTSSISKTLQTAALGYFSILGGSVGQLTEENIVHIISQLQFNLDTAGIGLNIRNSENCVEDPRNIFLATNYYKVPNHIKSQLDTSGHLGASAGINNMSKSIHLSKYGFRSFFSKWKINISLTVGPPSDGDPRKVNLYYKGEGVEIDLMKEVFGGAIDGINENGINTGDSGYDIPTVSIGEVAGENQAYAFSGITTNTFPSGSSANTGVPSGSTSSFFNEEVLNRFEIDHYNPFRNNFYQQWNLADVFAMGAEDISKRMEGNVIENIAKERIDTAEWSFGPYAVQGIVTQSNDPTSIQVGDQGWFMLMNKSFISTNLTLLSNLFGGSFNVSDLDDTSKFITIELQEYGSEEFLVPVGNGLSAGYFPTSTRQELDRAVGGFSLFEAPEECVIEPFNRMEVVTWGFDSGVFGSFGSLQTYYAPDGEIWMNVHLEEFTIKKFTGSSLCVFEGLTPMSSVDFHWSGGPDDSNCGICNEWKISEPIQLGLTYNGAEAEVYENLYVYNDVTYNFTDKNNQRAYIEGDCIPSCPPLVSIKQSSTGHGYLLIDYTPDGTEDNL